MTKKFNSLIFPSPFLAYLIVFVAIAINFRVSSGYEWPAFLVVNSGRDIRLLNVTDKIIRKTNSITTIIGKQTVLYYNLEFNIVMDVDIEARLIFFVNDKDELIMLPMDRPQLAKSVGVKILELTEALCVDWVTKKVYWSDRETNRIEMLTYNSNFKNEYANSGSIINQKPLLRKSILYKNLFQTTSICIDPIKGYLFFTNSFDRPSIERTWLDGSNRKILIQSENPFITYLTIDYIESKIYWLDFDSIYFSDYDGNNKKLLLKKSDSINSLSIFEEFLYWSNNSGIYYTPKNNENQYLKSQFSIANRLVEQISPNILRIFEPKKQLRPADFKLRNPCLHQNGNCSHICLYIPVAPHRVCACPTGIRLEKDNVTCAPGHSKILLIARRRDIRMISLDTPDDFADTVLPLNSTSHVVAVEYDPIENFLYWSDTDSEFQAIKRAKLDGSSEKTIISSELGHCDGLAIDWIARNIYWTDPGLHKIEVARLDGSARRVIVSSNVKNPRAIVVDPIRGYMYWTDWLYSKPVIERAYLDGSNRDKKFISLPEDYLPNGLVLDIKSNVLYYADARSDEIIRFDVSNPNEKEIIVDKGLDHVFGLTLLDDFLYWSDWQTRSLTRANKIDGSNRTILIEIADLMGVKAVDISVIPSGSNPCAINNGGCSHFCFYLPIGKICECPGDNELSTDNLNCILPDGYLLYTESRDDSLRRISLNNSNVNPYQLALNTDKRIIMIDYYWKMQQLYLVTNEDDYYGVIYSSYLNGTKPKKIIDNGISLIENVAIDWVAENIYFADIFYKSIQIAKISGEFRRIIVWENISQPLALAVHPLAGHIFWSDSADCTIKSSDLDGRNVKTILQNKRARVNSIVIDYQTDLLYYADQEASIFVLNLITLTIKKLINKDTKNVSPTLITLYYDQLYWLNFQQKSISTCNSSKNCTDFEELHKNKYDLIALTAVYSKKQTGKNACSTHKNDCQHLCLFSAPSSYRCACASHYTLYNGDMKSCRPPKAFILFTQRASIYRIKPKKFNRNNSAKEFSNNNHYYVNDDWENDDNKGQQTNLPPISLHRSPNDQILMLNFDPHSRNLIWISYNISNEKHNYFIHKSSENDLMTISDIKFPINNHNNFGYPIKIVYDPFSTLFFWISSLKSIQISCMISDTKIEHLGSFLHNSTQLLRNFDPKNLAVDGKRGYLYFVHEFNLKTKPKIVDGVFFNEDGVLRPLNKKNSDSNNRNFAAKNNVDDEKTVIFRCKLTNSEKCTILDTKINGVVSALSVDLMTGTIFWLSYTSQLDEIVDGRQIKNVSGSLNSLDFDGSHRQFMKLNEIYNDIAIYYDNVYLVGSSGYIDFVPKVFNNLKNFVNKIDGFIPSDDSTSKNDHQNNFKIQHLLLKINSKSIIFGITEEIFQAVLKSPCLRSSYCNSMCVYSENKSSNYECACPYNMALAHNGYMCQQKKDCELGEFTCTNNLQCVDNRKKCDNVKDCTDGSDESEFLCGPKDSKFPIHSHYACPGPTPSYIHKEFLCDGKYDCPDRSDEDQSVCGCTSSLRIYCVPLSGGPPLFCIKSEWRCNGYKDCQNGEDEKNCEHFNTFFNNIDGNASNYFLYSLLVLSLLLIFIGVYFFVRYNSLKTRSTLNRNPTNVNINVLNQHPSAPSGSTGAQTITTNIDLELALYPPRTDSTSRFTPMYSMPANSRADDNSSVSMFTNRPDLTGKSSSGSDNTNYLAFVKGGRRNTSTSTSTFDERRFFFDNSSTMADGSRRKPPSLASSYAEEVETAAAADVDASNSTVDVDWPTGDPTSRCRVSVRHKSTVKGSRSKSRSATIKKRLAIDAVSPPPSYSASVVGDDPNALEPCPSLASEENSELLEGFPDHHVHRNHYRSPMPPPPSPNTTTELNVSIALSHDASSTSTSAVAAPNKQTWTSMKRSKRKRHVTPCNSSLATRTGQRWAASSYRYRRVPACSSPANPPPTPNVTSASGSSDKSAVSGFSDV